MFQQIFDKYETIDVLVNNAGLQKDANLVDMTLEQWNQVIGVNLTGQFLCAREATKEFKRRGVVPTRSCSAGNIICMSSVHEAIALPLEQSKPLLILMLGIRLKPKQTYLS